MSGAGRVRGVVGDVGRVEGDSVVAVREWAAPAPRLDGAGEARLEPMTAPLEDVPNDAPE